MTFQLFCEPLDSLFAERNLFLDSYAFVTLKNSEVFNVFC